MLTDGRRKHIPPGRGNNFMPHFYGTITIFETIRSFLNLSQAAFLLRIAGLTRLRLIAAVVVLIRQ